MHHSMAFLVASRPSRRIKGQYAMRVCPFHSPNRIDSETR